MSHEPTTVRTFVHDAQRHGVPCSVTYDVEIPLAEHQLPDELFGHLVQQQKVLVPFQEGTGVHETCPESIENFRNPDRIPRILRTGNSKVLRRPCGGSTESRIGEGRLSRS